MILMGLGFQGVHLAPSSQWVTVKCHGNVVDGKEPRTYLCFYAFVFYLVATSTLDNIPK